MFKQLGGGGKGGDFGLRHTAAHRAAFVPRLHSQIADFAASGDKLLVALADEGALWKCHLCAVGGVACLFEMVAQCGGELDGEAFEIALGGSFGIGIARVIGIVCGFAVYSTL